MGIDLATLENSIGPDDEDESTDDVGEDETGDEEETDASEDESEEQEDASEGEESEEDDGTESGDDEDEETEDESAEEDDHDPEDISDSAKFKVGEEVITGAELKKGRLMQADYTRKTQALAEERKQLEAKNLSLLEVNDEVQEWAKSLSDPEEMHFELERHYPKAFAALKAKIIQEAVDEYELDDATKEARARARAAENREKAREKDQKQATTKAARRDSAQKTAALRVTFDKWCDETMGETGLDPLDREHHELLRNRIATRHRGTQWTRELFLAEAKAVAKLLGKAPKKPIKGKDGKFIKAKAKDDKKPVKKPEAKLPPGPRAGGVKGPSEKPEKKPAPRKDVAQGFAALRDKYGVR